LSGANQGTNTTCTFSACPDHCLQVRRLQVWHLHPLGRVQRAQLLVRWRGCRVVLVRGPSFLIAFYFLPLVWVTTYGQRWWWAGMDWRRARATDASKRSTTRRTALTSSTPVRAGWWKLACGFGFGLWLGAAALMGDRSTAQTSPRGSVLSSSTRPGGPTSSRRAAPSMWCSPARCISSLIPSHQYSKAGSFLLFSRLIRVMQHHEGFTNWPSPQSWNWNSADVGTSHCIHCGSS
jgi:hypothetical protein